MAGEEAICGFGAGGLETFSLIAFGVLSIGLFSVFGGKFFKKEKESENIEITPMS